MSDGNEFQRSEAATGNVHRKTVVSRSGGTSSWCDDVCDLCAGQLHERHEPADSGMVARDHIAPETP